MSDDKNKTMLGISPFRLDESAAHPTEEKEPVGGVKPKVPGLLDGDLPSLDDDGLPDLDWDWPDPGLDADADADDSAVPSFGAQNSDPLSPVGDEPPVQRTAQFRASDIAGLVRDERNEQPKMTQPVGGAGGTIRFSAGEVAAALGKEAEALEGAADNPRSASGSVPAFDEISDSSESTTPHTGTMQFSAKDIVGALGGAATSSAPASASDPAPLSEVGEGGHTGTMRLSAKGIASAAAAKATEARSEPAAGASDGPLSPFTGTMQFSAKDIVGALGDNASQAPPNPQPDTNDELPLAPANEATEPSTSAPLLAPQSTATHASDSPKPMVDLPIDSLANTGPGSTGTMRFSAKDIAGEVDRVKQAPSPSPKAFDLEDEPRASSPVPVPADEAGLQEVEPVHAVPNTGQEMPLLSPQDVSGEAFHGESHDELVDGRVEVHAQRRPTVASSSQRRVDSSGGVPLAAASPSLTGPSAETEEQRRPTAPNATPAQIMAAPSAEAPAPPSLAPPKVEKNELLEMGRRVSMATERASHKREVKPKESPNQAFMLIAGFVLILMLIAVVYSLMN